MSSTSETLVRAPPAQADRHEGASVSPQPTPLLLLSLALISAATLGYEVLLMRLFSIIQWHHFAYMIISLALLGYGASGALLSLTSRRQHGRFAVAYVGNAALFGLSALGCFLVAQRIPFNPLEILWDHRQWSRLLLIYLLLLLPFLCAANCVCLALSEYKSALNRIYAMDLGGAGAGALGIILLLHVLFPIPALEAIAAVAFLAAALGWLGLGGKLGWAALIAVIGMLLPLVVPADWREIKVTDYKGLHQILQVIGTRIVGERSSPLGLISVVESPKVPLRYAPGMSVNAAREPPAQLGLFTDADAMSVITRFRGGDEEISYLDSLTSALPYHLLPKPRVLILGTGGGTDVLQALYHHASRIDAVELNPQVIDLVRHDFGEFAGHIYDRPDVHVHVAEARSFVAGSDQRSDLIQVALLDAFNTSSAGLYALNESYTYTVEAIREYLHHLAPGGMLALTRWVRLPPTDGLKLLATVVTALEQEGIGDPGRRLAWIRGWKTHTLLVKNAGWTSIELDKIRAFCASRWFDLAFIPGMQATEANRYNVLPSSYFFEGASSLLGAGRDGFMDRYKFNILPATDDRPYFFQFFKWSALPEILALRGTGGLSQLDLGYLVLVATLIQAIGASVVLVLVPLWLSRRERSVDHAARRWRVAVYFLSIGLAFMFIEIAFVQKLILYLGHPLYAVSAVLTGFLIFAGLGSRTMASAGARPHDTRVVLAVSGIGVLSVAYVWLIPIVFAGSAALPEGAKVAISLALIAPLALCMGRPFPHGMSRLAIVSAELIPWAWGINGCASVLGAVLATLTAIHVGMNAVVTIAIALYLIAAWARP